MAGLAQLAKSLTAEREGGHGFDSWNQTNTQGVKKLRNVVSAFAL